MSDELSHLNKNALKPSKRDALSLSKREWNETEFGTFPKEWNLKKVNDLKSSAKYAIAMGPFGSNIKAENFVKEGVPVIKGKNLNSYKYVVGEFDFLTEEKANELISSNCKSGDLVFTHRGTIGQVGLIPNNKYKRYIVSQSGMKLTVNDELVSNVYLFYFFISDFGQYQLLKYEAQVGVPSISNPLTSLKEIEIPLPPLPEQKAIAAVLSSLDDKIDLLHRQNKTLEAMAETLFRKWFIEEADESWEEVRLGEFITTNNKTITKKLAPEIIKYLDTSSLNDGMFDDLKTHSFTDAPSRARRCVLHNDILISTVRPNQKHFGIVKNPDDRMIVSTGFCVITCKKINPHFVYLLLTTKEMTEYLHSIAEGSTSTYPSLKPSDIEALEFNLPPGTKLREFSPLVDSIWTKIEKNYYEIKTLEKLRDTLLPKLMSGEVRVRE